jgi:hypothetical protein
MIDGQAIEDAVWSYAQKLKADKDIALQAWHLENALEPFGVVVDFDTCLERPHNHVKVYGYYIPKIDLARIVLRSNVPLNPLSGKKLTEFLFEVNCTAQHELIHKYQWLHRDSDNHRPTNIDSHYLGNQDEIETQAHDAAMEIRFYYPDMNPRDVLRGYFTDPKISLPSVNGYMKVFKDPSHPVVKQFLRKTYGWLDHVIVTRPVTYRLKG